MAFRIRLHGIAKHQFLVALLRLSFGGIARHQVSVAFRSRLHGIAKHEVSWQCSALGCMALQSIRLNGIEKHQASVALLRIWLNVIALH